MMLNDEKDKKSFSAMMKGRAVYIALSACVLAAGVLSFTAARTTLSRPYRTVSMYITPRLPR